MGLSTKNFLQQIQFTRPTDTTPYTAADAVSDDTTTATINTFTLKGVASRINGGGEIQSLVFHKTTQNLVNADFDVYVFDTAPLGTVFEDNAAHALTDANLQALVGFVELRAANDAVAMITGDVYHVTNLNWAYECKGGTTNLYVVVIARAAYTPGNAEVFTLRFGGRVN